MRNALTRPVFALRRAARSCPRYVCRHLCPLKMTIASSPIYLETKLMEKHVTANIMLFCVLALAGCAENSAPDLEKN